MIIDDDPRMLLALDAMLELDDRVDVAATCPDGTQGVETVQRVEAEAVLVDLHMPCLDGVGVLQRLREACPHVRVVIMSASAELEEAARVHDAGADGFVGKDSAAVLVDALLDGHR